MVSVLALASCGTSKQAQKVDSSSKEVWQTMLVKQIDCQINEDILAVKYDNGQVLYYKILDNSGNVALTWDRSGKRQSYDAGKSSYSGRIDIPSFVTSGEKDDFVFNVAEIDDNAFWGCSGVTRISLPYSILRIRNGAFHGCSGLKEIYVNSNNESYCDHEGVLFSKDSKLLVQYPAQRTSSEYEVPQGVNVICAEAFAGCNNLEKVTLSNDVSALSDYSFTGCANLKELRLGSSVRIIGKDSFKDCKNLAFIHSPNFFPPHNCPVVFEKETKDNAKVVVPRGMKPRYMMNLEWNEFKNISEEY